MRRVEERKSERREKRRGSGRRARMISDDGTERRSCGRVDDSAVLDPVQSICIFFFFFLSLDTLAFPMTSTFLCSKGSPWPCGFTIQLWVLFLQIYSGLFTLHLNTYRERKLVPASDTESMAGRYLNVRCVGTVESFG